MLNLLSFSGVMYSRCCLCRQGNQSTDLGEDVHTVASLLKLYLRDLPEPVVDHYNYRKIIDATKGMYIHYDTYVRMTTSTACIHIALNIILPNPTYTCAIHEYICM